MTLCKLISGKRFAVYDNMVEGPLGISRRLLRLLHYREHLAALISISYILWFCMSVLPALDLDAQHRLQSMLHSPCTLSYLAYSVNHLRG